MVSIVFQWSWISFAAGVVATVAVAFIASVIVAVRQSRKGSSRRLR